MFEKFLKTSCFLIFLFSFVFSVFSYDLGKNINSGAIPLPADSKKVDIPSLPLGQGQALVYTSSLTRERLVSFFTKRLSQKNWVFEKSAYDQVKNNEAALSEMKTDFSGGNNALTSKGLLQSIFKFKKGSTQLMLMVMPQKSKDNRTIFSLAAFDSSQQEDFNQSEKSLKIKNVPDYPKSNKIFSDKRVVVLSSQDAPREVIKYYKTTMPGRGWRLEKEEPLTAKEIKPSLADVSQGIEKGSSSGCPSCDKVGEALDSLSEATKKKVAEGHTIREGKLIFKDSEDNSCLISVSDSDLEITGQNDSSGSTTINIMQGEAIKLSN